MKLFLTLIMVSIFSISSKTQILKLDLDFGKNGVLALLDQKWAPGITPNLFYFDGSYYLTSSREVDSLHYLTIAKITKEGILDDSYFQHGINNTNINLAQIDSFESTIQRIFFYLTTDGNLYILAHVLNRNKPGPSSSKIVIFKLNLDGELDLSVILPICWTKSSLS